MFRSEQEVLTYIAENYSEITDFREDGDHYNIYCSSPKCQIIRSFQVVEQQKHGFKGQYGSFVKDFQYPDTIVLRCPVCKFYKIWLVYQMQEEKEIDGGITTVDKYYRVLSIPDEGEEDIEILEIAPIRQFSANGGGRPFLRMTESS